MLKEKDFDDSFVGICMAIKLKLSGIPFRVLEKKSGLGGVWEANKYPGETFSS